MTDVDRLLKDLKNVASCYVSVPEQKAAYNTIVESLRLEYRKQKTSFTDGIVQTIRECKRAVETYCPTAELSFERDSSASLTDGAIVFHKKEYYVGAIDGTTAIRHLFENQNDDEEFRVRIPSQRKLKIASPESLKVLGTAYTNRCYRCRGYVGYTLTKCKSCGWFICRKCGACGCGYKRRE